MIPTPLKSDGPRYLGKKLKVNGFAVEPQRFSESISRKHTNTRHIYLKDIQMKYNRSRLYNNKTTQHIFARIQFLSKKKSN
ncbi:hypothetical protein Y032_0048g1659 [Ancylostoma ceylanicum]|uniref:Uncharacterized protein n=1 Tax=Ancylostoma ceylanicum TaxID=53326 RepID=A0A016UB65_9BILA|nr:hypothetical protein Y032_0048g1659 [Ancylostoma ceylanicum]